MFFLSILLSDPSELMCFCNCVDVIVKTDCGE